MHQMTPGGKNENLSDAGLVELAAAFGVARQGREIRQQVSDALGRWPDHARAAGVPDDRISLIAREIRARRATPG